MEQPESVLQTSGYVTVKSYDPGAPPEFVWANPRDVHKQNDVHVSSYSEMVQIISFLAYENPHCILFFRGQPVKSRIFEGWGNRRDCLFPTIYRFLKTSSDPAERAAAEAIAKHREWYTKRWMEIAGESEAGAAVVELLGKRFRELQAFSKKLRDKVTEDGFPDAYRDRLLQYPVARWSMLRHYEKCLTPFMDITISPRVACSFALMDYENSTDEETHYREEGYVYVLGLPQLSGHVTVSAESHVKMIRLLSIAPPFAERPNFQEAYLVGTYPVPTTLEDLKECRISDVDMIHKVICRFKLTNAPSGTFAGRYPLLEKGSLMPLAENDRFREFMDTHF